MDIQDALPQYQATIVDVMERVFEQYPILCGAVSYVVMDEYTSVALAKLQWEQAQSLVRMGLHLNYPLFRDPNLEQRTTHGPLQRIIAHECAHLIEFALALKQSGVVAGQQAGYEKLQRCMRRLNERSFARNLRAAALMASHTAAGDIPALVSAYATKNEAEFMAEAFAEGMTREDANALVKETCAQLQRWAVKYA